MIIAFIPVRGGSKSIPLKNIKPFCGKPLVCWNIEALENCPEVDEIICRAVNYDVMCGVARRAWAGNPHALETVSLYQEPGNTLTLPFSCDDQELSEMINGLSK